MQTHVFLLYSALLAIVSIRDARASANDASPLVGPVVTLVTNAHQGARPHIRVANHAFAITFLAKTPDSWKFQNQN